MIFRKEDIFYLIRNVVLIEGEMFERSHDRKFVLRCDRWFDKHNSVLSNLPDFGCFSRYLLECCVMLSDDCFKLLKVFLECRSVPDCFELIERSVSWRSTFTDNRRSLYNMYRQRLIIEQAVDGIVLYRVW